VSSQEAEILKKLIILFGQIILEMCFHFDSEHCRIKNSKTKKLFFRELILDWIEEIAILVFASK
jgi:hypothetical protein